MEYVDHKAREMANRAIALIEAHERVCTERATAAANWRSSTTDILAAIKKSVSGLYSRLWVAACSLITVLLGIIGYLLTHPLH